MELAANFFPRHSNSLLIPAHRRLKQEDHVFAANLGYIAGSYFKIQSKLYLVEFPNIAGICYIFLIFLILDLLILFYIYEFPVYRCTWCLLMSEEV